MDHHPLSPKFKRLISRTDLHSGDHLLKYVQLFNRRLTKRMSTCHMQIISATQAAPTGIQDDDDEQVLRGGVKINFKFKDPVQVRSELQIMGQGKPPEVFLTDFRFSNKSVLLICVTNKVGFRLKSFEYFLKAS